MVGKATSWKATLLRAALGGAMLLGGSLLPGGTAQAHDRDDHCRVRLRRAEVKLERDIERHGFYSHQVQRDRRRIRELRQQCRSERGRFRRGDGDFDRDDRPRGRHRGWDRDHDWDDRGRHRGWDRDRD